MRILVIEDEHKIAQVLKAGLSEEGFAVDLCFDGEDGLLTAMSQEYDLIILDRMLPDGIDGVDLCRELRAKGNHTPLIIVTAKDRIDDRVTGLYSGADDYIVKPFSFTELLARIHALLRRPHDMLNETLTADDLTIATSSKAVQRAGQAIALSATEYALLEYLLRNKNRVVSKNTLINHVWDFDANVLPNTVEVYVTFLRNKLEKPFNNRKLIHTVRGFGYKITDPDTA